MSAPPRISPEELFDLFVEHPELLEEQPGGDEPRRARGVPPQSARPPRASPNKHIWADKKFGNSGDGARVEALPPRPLLSPTSLMRDAYWPEHTLDGASTPVAPPQQLFDRAKRRGRRSGGVNRARAAPPSAAVRVRSCRSACQACAALRPHTCRAAVYNRKWLALAVLCMLALCAVAVPLYARGGTTKRSCDARVLSAQHRAAERARAQLGRRGRAPALERQILERQLHQMETTVQQQQQRWLQQHLEHAKMSAQEQAGLVAHEEHLTKTIGALSNRLQESRVARGSAARNAEQHERQFDEQERRLFATIDALQAKLDAAVKHGRSELAAARRELAAARAEHARVAQKLALAQSNLGAANKAGAQMQAAHSSHSDELVARLLALQTKARRKNGALVAKLREAALENERLRTLLTQHGINARHLSKTAKKARAEAEAFELRTVTVEKAAAKKLAAQSREFEEHQMTMEAELSKHEQANGELLATQRKLKESLAVMAEQHRGVAQNESQVRASSEQKPAPARRHSSPCAPPYPQPPTERTVAFRSLLR